MHHNIIDTIVDYGFQILVGIMILGTIGYVAWDFLKDLFGKN